jgi:hypothetical protein
MMGLILLDSLTKYDNYYRALFNVVCGYVNAFLVNAFLIGQLLMRVYHAIFLKASFALEKINHAIALSHLWF